MVARITIEDNHLLTIEATKQTLDLIDRFFLDKDMSECWVRGKFRKENIKLVHFLIRDSKVETMALMPIGLLTDLENYLIAQKAIYKIFDKRKIEKYDYTDEEIKNCLGYIELYDYQIDAVKACLSNPVGIVKAIMSAGKTEIFTALCKLTNKKTLILFKRIDLAKQTLERMTNAKLDAGIVQGTNIKENHQIVMATVQSGHKLQNQYDMIISDECFPYNIEIKTEFGVKHIGAICNSKSTERVWSFDNNKNDWQLKPITNWIIKESNEIICLKINGKSNIKCTLNHPLFLDNYKKVEAKDIMVGDKIIAKPNYLRSNSRIPKLSNDQYQSVLGMILGDSSIHKTKNMARLRFAQGEKQFDYLLYKIKVLNNQFITRQPCFGKSGYQPKNKVYYITTGCSEDYNDIFDKVYVNGSKTIKNVINEIDKNSLAFWIMDDGSLIRHNGKNNSFHYELSTHSFSKEDNEIIINVLKNKFDINSKIKYDFRCKKYYIIFNTESTAKIANLIHSYVPLSMNYKLPKEFQNKLNYNPKFESYSVLRIKSIKKIKYKNPIKVFNITVEKNHNYLVGAGYLVSNCHNASSDQYQVLLRNKHTLYRYGFSATPFVKGQGLKNKKIKSWLGDIIYTVPTDKLLEEQRISNPTIHMIPIVKPNDIIDKKWPFCETVGIIQNEYRNKVIAELCNNLEGQKLILVQKIDHGITLESMVNDSYFLYGDTEVAERRETVKRFDSGEPFTIIASTIFDEGIDIKSVNHVIIAGGGQSFVKVLQRVGRGLRTTATKTTVDIYDFYDTTNVILERHSNERIKTYKSEGFDDIQVLKVSEIDKIY